MNITTNKKKSTHGDLEELELFSSVSKGLTAGENIVAIPENLSSILIDDENNFTLIGKARPLPSYAWNIYRLRCQNTNILINLYSHYLNIGNSVLLLLKAICAYKKYHKKQVISIPKHHTLDIISFLRDINNVVFYIQDCKGSSSLTFVYIDVELLTSESFLPELKLDL